MKTSFKISFGVGTLLIFFAGIIAANAFSTGLETTNSTEFCTSCHSMQWVKKEWQESIHFSNASGVRAECRDCHVPHPTGPKLYAKLMAAKDVWHEILGTIDTEEKFEAHRWNMANRVWTKMLESDSRECRSCHTPEAMDLALQGKSARKKHRRAEERGQTCVKCHRGVAHEEPIEP
ncbi:MAG: NapC/NirT family cytochrome c [Candidatus Oxydemutatoraceae bacterium WSBS_2016_MAG_OTU14]